MNIKTISMIAAAGIAAAAIAGPASATPTSVISWTPTSVIWWGADQQSDNAAPVVCQLEAPGEHAGTVNLVASSAADCAAVGGVIQ